MSLQKQLLICDSEPITIQSYAQVVQERFIEASFMRKFNPNKMNGVNFANYLNSFERIPSEKYEERYQKVLDEVMALSPKNLREVLEHAFGRIER